MEQKILVQFPGEEPYFLESKETPIEAALIIIKGHETEIKRMQEALLMIKHLSNEEHIRALAHQTLIGRNSDSK